MKEFIEKLITRIMLESASCKVYKLINPNMEDIAEFNAYKKCIEIVNQLSEEYKPKTNADRIRSMTDEGLAEFLCELDTIGTEPKSLWNGEFWIDEGEELLNWLQSEVEGE